MMDLSSLESKKGSVAICSYLFHTKSKEATSLSKELPRMYEGADVGSDCSSGLTGKSK